MQSHFSFSPEIHRMTVVDSTNSRLKELARAGSGEGTAVLAETQTHGRGRSQRNWHSPHGGMYFSILLSPNSPHRFPDLALLAGVALAQAVKQCLPKSHDVTLKWPNDCLIGSKKVGGILCEKISEKFAVVGMGLNINIPIAQLSNLQERAFPATSFLVESGGGTFKVDDIVDAVVTKLRGVYETYRKDGFNPIRYLWEKNCNLIGKRLEVRDSGVDSTSAGIVGTFLGLDESGALVLAEGPGETRRLFSGEITCCWL